MKILGVNLETHEFQTIASETVTWHDYLLIEDEDTKIDINSMNNIGEKDPMVEELEQKNLMVNYIWKIRSS